MKIRAAVLERFVYLFGGGETLSTPSVVRIEPRTGSAVEVPALGNPLSDLGAVVIGGRAYLSGGYTDAEFSAGIVRYVRSGGTTPIARLPYGTRYAGVTAIGAGLTVSWQTAAMAA